MMPTSTCAKCGHPIWTHDPRGEPMGCQESGCPCREYRIYYSETHHLASAIRQEIDEFRAKHSDIPKTKEQELEIEVEQLKSELYKERQLSADWAVENAVKEDKIKKFEELAKVSAKALKVRRVALQWPSLEVLIQRWEAILK